MKLKYLVLSVLAGLALALAVSAAEHKHDQARKRKIATPNGGRLLAGVEPHAEFLVRADRRVQITFVDDAGKPVAPAAQAVTVTTGSRLSPTRLAFARSGDVLVSDVALPEGKNLPAVVQIKVKPDAKIVTERFNVDLSRCPDCKLAEYACTCAH